MITAALTFIGTGAAAGALLCVFAEALPTIRGTEVKDYRTAALTGAKFGAFAALIVVLVIAGIVATVYQLPGGGA